MKLFNIRQNNSGGGFGGPSVNVYIEAENQGAAESLTEPYFSLCGDSGKYADYDNCGCCPCCGHRWVYMEEEENLEWEIKSIVEDGIFYMGQIATSLIKEDGSIIIGDNHENLDKIIKILQEKLLTSADSVVS